MIQERCVTCGHPYVLARNADGYVIRVNPDPDPAGRIALGGDRAAEDHLLAVYAVPAGGDLKLGVPAGAPRYNRHTCPVDPDEDDGGVGEILVAQESILDQHRDHCVAGAISDAIDHGTDDPTAFRQVAAQFLDWAQTRCVCAQEPGEFDFPHEECIPAKRRLLSTDAGNLPDDWSIIPTANAPYGDEAIWDCPHGFVYRVERKAGR